MISVIICARQTDIAPELRKNIDETIGVPYEIIVIDNSENRYTIFSAYNKGVELSRHPLLLFMHDDIHYHTNEWGRNVVAHFADKNVGGIGLAGTHYLSFISGAWWSSGVGHLYLLQSTNKNAEPEMNNYFPQGEDNGGEVVVLDGVWFCIRRELFSQVRFDEDNFKGFHFYDVDTTLQVSQLGHKLLCIKDILIHHQSLGVLNETWVKNAFLFHGKWKDRLPVSLVRYKLSEECEMEYRVLNELMSTQIRSGWKKAKVYRTAIKTLTSYKKAHRYFKTPFWISKLILQYFKSSLLGK